MLSVPSALTVEVDISSLERVVFSFLRVAPACVCVTHGDMKNSGLALFPRTGVGSRVLISRSDWGQIRLWVLGRLAQLWVSVGSSHQRVQ